MWTDCGGWSTRLPSSVEVREVLQLRMNGIRLLHCLLVRTPFDCLRLRKMGLALAAQVEVGAPIVCRRLQTMTPAACG
jgi:hypothetical protein